MTAPRRFLAPLAVLLGLGCSSVLEVPVETPLQSKLDVSAFRRILIAGFVTDLEDSDVDLSAETSRLLQNQLRSNTRLQVLEPDRPPLQDALEKALEKIGEGGSYNKDEKDQYRLEADRLLQDPEFWRKMGEFDKARESYEKALALKPGDIYIQQNFDLFREADDKRNRKSRRKK